MKQISDSPLGRKPLFNKLPDDSAGIEEWREWANDVIKWGFTISKGEKKRRRQLSLLRKELKRKENALRSHKMLIEDLEGRIAGYEKSFLFKLGKFFRRRQEKENVNE